MKKVVLEFMSPDEEIILSNPLLHLLVGEIKKPKKLEQAIWVHLQSLIISEPNNKWVRKYYDIIEENTDEKIHPSEVILETFNQSFTIEIGFAKYLSVNDLISANLLKPVNWIGNLLLRFLCDLQVGYFIERKAWITQDEIRLALKPRFLGEFKISKE